MNKGFGRRFHSLVRGDVALSSHVEGEEGSIASVQRRLFGKEEAGSFT